MITNKDSLSKLVSTSHGLSEAEARRILDTIFDKIKDDVILDKKVSIAGFGTFYAKQRNKRTTFIPSTGKFTTTLEKSVPAFNPAKEFKNKMLL